MPIQDIPLTNKMHAVPQNFMDVEFKLIGDLTMRQFTYLMIGGVSAYLTYSTVGGVFKWPFVLFLVILGLSFAFLPIQERGLDVWLVNLFKAIYSPTLRIWKKAPVIPSALLYENLNVVKQELITLAPTSSRRKLEEYLQYQYKKEDEDPLDIPEMEFVKRVRDAFAPDVELANANSLRAAQATSSYGQATGQSFGRQIGQQIEQWGFGVGRDISVPQVQPVQPAPVVQPEPQAPQKPIEPEPTPVPTPTPTTTPVPRPVPVQPAPVPAVPTPAPALTPTPVPAPEPKIDAPQAPSAQDLLETHPIKEIKATPAPPQTEPSAEQLAPVQLDWKYPTGADTQKKVSATIQPSFIKPVQEEKTLEPEMQSAEIVDAQTNIEITSPFKKLINMFSPPAPSQPIPVQKTETPVPEPTPVKQPETLTLETAPVKQLEAPTPTPEPIAVQKLEAPQPVVQSDQVLHSFKTATSIPIYSAPPLHGQAAPVAQPNQSEIIRHPLLRGERPTRKVENERTLAPMTPDMHSGRKFTNLLPSKGELVLPIRGERVLKTSEDLNVDDNAKEKALKLQQMMGQFKNSKDYKQTANQTQNAASISEVMERVNQNMNAQPTLTVSPTVQPPQIPFPTKPLPQPVPEPTPVTKLEPDTKKDDVFDDAQKMIEKLNSENEKLQSEIDKLKTDLSQQAQSSDEANKKEIITRLEQQKQKNSSDYSTLVKQIHELRTRLTQKDKPQQEDQAPKKPETAYANIQPLTSAPNVITGIVVNEDGKTLDGVLLIIKNDKGDAVRAIKTNMIGQFMLSTPVLNGIYTIEVNSGKIEGQSFGIISVETKGEVLPPVEIRGRKV